VKELARWTTRPHRRPELDVRKSIGGIYSTKKRRAEILQPGLAFDNFKPGLKVDVSSNASPGGTVRLLVAMNGVF
jgi:hypothetical protein